MTEKIYLETLKSALGRSISHYYIQRYKGVLDVFLKRRRNIRRERY